MLNMDDHKPRETASPGRVKGFKVRTLNTIMIFVSCALYIALLVVTFHASQHYETMVAATNLYIDCQENAALVADGSDYLTEQVHLFVVNLDPEYADHYFTEVHVTRRRDRALERLEDRADPHAQDYLQTALDLSNQLMEQETYAMRLAAEGGWSGTLRPAGRDPIRRTLRSPLGPLPGAEAGHRPGDGVWPGVPGRKAADFQQHQLLFKRRSSVHPNGSGNQHGGPSPYHVVGARLLQPPVCPKCSYFPHDHFPDYQTPAGLRQLHPQGKADRDHRRL